MNNTMIYIVLAGILIVMTTCIPEPDFKIPQDEIINSGPEPNSNLITAINVYEQAGKEMYTFKKEETLLVEAYVISSDAAGNFYKTLVVQDHHKKPLAGVELKIDLRSYHSIYNFGRKLVLDLSGLSMEKRNGKYIIGYVSGGNMVNIPEELLKQHMSRTADTYEITGQHITLEEVSETRLNTYVIIEDLQFVSEDLGRSFASESYDSFNGERQVEQCDNLARCYLFTSTFASFRNNVLPEMPFSMRAVLTSDVYSGKVTLILNEPGGINANEKKRCDQIHYLCSELDINREEDVIFYENFDRVSRSTDIEKIGWYNTNVNFNNEKFRKRSENENIFLQISAYDSGEYVMEVWLVSPPIDMNDSENEYLTFDCRTTFEDGSLLTVWISSNFGTAGANAEWQQLNISIPKGSRDGSNGKFVACGPVSLECIDGPIWVGFRYLGSDPDASTTYDLDNILIRGKKLTN